jgi:hypothetical protein
MIDTPDAGAVPDGVFGPHRPRRRQRHHLQALGIEVLPCRRQGRAPSRFHRHEFLGRSIAPARRVRKIDPSRAAEITRLVVREFFGQEILKQPSAFLSGKQPMMGVTVVELRKP